MCKAIARRIGSGSVFVLADVNGVTLAVAAATRRGAIGESTAGW
jgi:hypothetical protein